MSSGEWKPAREGWQKGPPRASLERHRLAQQAAEKSMWTLEVTDQGQYEMRRLSRKKWKGGCGNRKAAHHRR